MKRRITLFTYFYSDAISLTDTIFRTIGVSLTRCDEEEWIYNSGCIRIECYDCIYYIYHA